MVKKLITKSKSLNVNTPTTNMGLEVKQPRAYFYLGSTIFLILFTFSAGIGLSATNNLATGLPLVLSCVVTIVLCILIIHFDWVTFPNLPKLPKLSKLQSEFQQNEVTV